MHLISLTHIKKEISGSPIFEDVNLHINRYDRVAIVGPNGAGKTTLLKIIAGIEEATRGEISKRRDLSMSYLLQETDFKSDMSITDVITSELSLEKIEYYGGKEAAISFAKKILNGMGFSQQEMDRSLNTFSGGWKRRVYFSKLLFLSPDLLLLDEPTNHLDIESLLWLEEYLNNYNGAILMVCHDRRFINKTCTKICELLDCNFNTYTGNYDDYKIAKEEAQRLLELKYKHIIEERERIEEFVSKYKADRKRAGLVKSREKALEKIEIPEIKKPRSQRQIFLPECDRAPRIMITLENVTKKYSDKSVLDNITLSIQRNDKVGIVGPNGSGKTTLLKILAGKMAPDSGKATISQNVNLFYYSQELLEELDSEISALLEIEKTRQDENSNLRNLLGLFGLSGDIVFKKVKLLSGGEKARVTLTKIFTTSPNILLLDEPTNHLDVETREVLENALREFKGSICIISHDRELLNRVTNKIISVKDGKIDIFHGNYDDYTYSLSQEYNRDGKDEKVIIDSQPIKDSKERKRIEASARNTTYQQRQDLKNRLNSIEKEIELLEAKKKEINEYLEYPENYKDGMAIKEKKTSIKDIEEKLQKRIHDWEELQVQFEGLKTQ